MSRINAVALLRAVDKPPPRPLASGKPFAANAFKLLSAMFAFACVPAAAQVCQTDKAIVHGTIKIDDSSSPPCHIIDLWAIPEAGSWVELGKVTWGDVTAARPPGTWRFAVHACGTYFPFRPSAPVRCARSGQGCVECLG